MWNKLTFVRRKHPGPDRSMYVIAEDVTRETKQITVLSRIRGWAQEDKSMLCHKLGSRLTRRHCWQTQDMRIKSSIVKCEKIFSKRASDKWGYFPVLFSVSLKATTTGRLKENKVHALDFIKATKSSCNPFNWIIRCSEHNKEACYFSCVLFTSEVSVCGPDLKPEFLLLL